MIPEFKEKTVLGSNVRQKGARRKRKGKRPRTRVEGWMFDAPICAVDAVRKQFRENLARLKGGERNRYRIPEYRGRVRNLPPIEKGR